MAILFCGLVVRGEVRAELDATAGTLLQHLSLLFVPARVGIVVHLHPLAQGD